MEFWVIIPIAVFGFIYIAEKLNRIEKKNDARLKRMEDRLQLISKEMGIVDREPFGFSLLEAKQYVDKL